MSCDAAASAAYLLLAAFAPAQPVALDRMPAVAVAPGTNPLAREPLFAEIVGRARALKDQVDGLRAESDAGALPVETLPRFAAFQAEIAALAELDMRGHHELAGRGTDGDLTCILRGIAQDLPQKLNDMVAARDPAARDLALREMAYLLVDNAEVIVAPPAPEV